MMLMEFSMTPLAQGESVSPYVARCVKLIDESGLDYELHSMGTIVEGPRPQLLELLEKCFAALEVDCDRISCMAKFDFRKGRTGRLQSKVASVEEKLGRPPRRVTDS